jgi:hypothetical protein
MQRLLSQKNFLVNVLKINGKIKHMNFKEIAQNYDKSKRKMMSNAIVKNRKYMANFAKYDAESLNLMYAEWHLLFPTHKQDINCSSCRKAVNKFWETMLEEWIELEQTPKTKTKKTSGSKKTKAK